MIGVHIQYRGDAARVLNPEAGFFATANDDLNRYGIEKPINMPMGSYRSERINALLAKKQISPCRMSSPCTPICIRCKLSVL